jgi:hypothetical protein
MGGLSRRNFDGRSGFFCALAAGAAHAFSGVAYVLFRAADMTTD